MVTINHQSLFVQKKKKSELKRGCFANMDLCYSLLRGLSQYISNTSYMAALHKNHDENARHMNECNLFFCCEIYDMLWHLGNRKIQFARTPYKP